MSTSCCVEGCDNTKERYPSKGTYYDGRFLTFPVRRERRKLWNDIIGSSTITTKFICSEHFTDDDWVIEDIVMNVPKSKRRLKPNVIPSRKLPIIAEVKEPMDEETRKRVVAEAMAEYEKLNSGSRKLAGRALAKNTPSNVEETRKRQVAQALAAYENNQNSDSCSSLQSDAKQPTKKKKKQQPTKKRLQMRELSEAQIEDPLPLRPAEINDNNSTDVKSTAEKELEYSKVLGSSTCGKELEVAVAEMELSGRECNFFVNQQRKCGEVILDANDITFSLNCSLCPGVFLNLMSFSNHILTYHTSLLKQNSSSNPLDGHAGNTVELSEKQKDLTSSSSEPNVVILQKTIQIDKLDNVDELVNNNISDNESEESFASSFEMLPNDNETNEISIHNKALIMQLIKLLKQSQFHLIWDETHSEYRCRKKRKETITELITSLLEYFQNLPVTYIKIISILKQLRMWYVKELKERQEANQKNEPYICKLWCFNELHFLEVHIQNFKRLNLTTSHLQTHIENDENSGKQHPLAPLVNLNSTLTEQEIIDVIKEYERHRYLWNVSHPRYQGKFKDFIRLHKFQLKIQKYNRKIRFNEQTTLEQVVQHMLDWYIAEVTLQQETIKSNQDFQSNFPRIFAAMAFLSGNVPPFKCKLCEKEFIIEHEYMRHLRESKKRGCLNINVIYECQYCHKRYDTKKKLDVHIRTHTGERPYHCPKCDKKFHKSSIWSRHKLIHNSKTFKCDKCQKLFHSARILRVHQKIHLENREKKFCKICGQSFLWNQSLKQHYRLHREKPTITSKRKRSTTVDSENGKKKNKVKVTKKRKTSK